MYETTASTLVSLCVQRYQCKTLNLPYDNPTSDEVQRRWGEDYHFFPESGKQNGGEKKNKQNSLAVNMSGDTFQ